MMADPVPLVPVGRDCWCGYPLVLAMGQQRCSVYGAHHPMRHVAPATSIRFVERPELADQRRKQGGC